MQPDSPAMEPHVRLWLEEWKARWYALPLSLLPASPFPPTISGKYLVSQAPSHEASLGVLIVQGLLGDAQAIVRAHELQSSEILSASRKIEGYPRNRAAINAIVSATLKRRVSPPAETTPFVEEIFRLGMLRVHLRLAAGDPDADRRISQFFANQSSWRRAEYLYLCSLPETVSKAPHLGYEKSAPTWKDVADSLHPELIKSSDPDFEDFVRQFVEARRTAKPRKPKKATAQRRHSQSDRFRDVVLDHWLPLGLWLMEYDRALSALRQLNLLPNLGVADRKMDVSKLAKMVQEKSLYHHPSTPLKSLVIKDRKVVGSNWKNEVEPQGAHA